MASPQVSWPVEIRRAAEVIIAATTPGADVISDIKFKLASYSVPLILMPAVGFREGCRQFQVFYGPMAGVQTGLQRGSFVGDMIHRANDFLRVDIRYVMSRTEPECLSKLNDMMASDSQNLSWRLDPEVSGPLWGQGMPIMLEWAGNQVLGSPIDQFTEGAQNLNVILSLFYRNTFDLGQRL